MSLSRAGVLTLVTAVVAAVALMPPPGPAGAAEHDPPQPRVVVAMSDTGINPYHEVYHRPENTEHPCTWVEGYDDCSIPALELSIGEYDTFEEAYAADQHIWDSLELHQWYWIPRTNIIGAVCEGSGSLSHTSLICIYDEDGHGTGTSSSVLSEAPDALLLFHEGNAGAYDLATAPVVPDIQSHSWGPPAPLPLWALDALIPGEFLCGDGTFDDETILFLSAGNEALFPTIADCFRADPRVQVVGGGWPDHTSAASWSVFDFTSWYCRPTADIDTISGMRESYCGTSFSAPTAAGTAAAALLEIRRAEGFVGGSTPEMVSATVSREAFLQGLRLGTTFAPEQRFPNTPQPYAVPTPEQGRWAFWGYGWLDANQVDDVVACVLEATCREMPAEEAAYHAGRQGVRHAFTDGALPNPPQDDAGSGRDAGETRRHAVDVDTGVDLAGQLVNYLLGPDREDWYTFELSAGDTMEVAFASEMPICARVVGPDDADFGGTCSSSQLPGTMTFTAEQDGQHVLSFFDLNPVAYTFRIHQVEGSA